MEPSIEIVIRVLIMLSVMQRGRINTVTDFPALIHATSLSH